MSKPNHERHYRDLSELYRVNYEFSVEVAEALMSIQGVTTEMISDLMAYHERNGSTENFQRSMNRILLMESKLGRLSEINTENYTLNLVNRRLSKRNLYLEARVVELEGQQNMSTAFESFELPLTPEE
jgi:hypothetical protein